MATHDTIKELRSDLAEAKQRCSQRKDELDAKKAQLVESTKRKRTLGEQLSKLQGILQTSATELPRLRSALADKTKAANASEAKLNKCEGGLGVRGIEVKQAVAPENYPGESASDMREAAAAERNPLKRAMMHAQATKALK